MPRITAPLTALLALALLSGCDTARSATAANDGGAALTLSDFSDGNWTFHVDRHYVADGTGNTNPTQPTAEEQYQPSAPREYQVVVSLLGQRVAIGETPWIGERIATQSNDLMFNLTEGAFAGGRFVVWQTPSGLQAEFTLYGSGVPIAQSERGALSRDPH